MDNLSKEREKENWIRVTRDDVIKAIDIYKKDHTDYKRNRAIDTFLKYEGNCYSAKTVRGIAYELANGESISKDRYSGGEETVRFFKKLGFEVLYPSDCKEPWEK